MNKQPSRNTPVRSSIRNAGLVFVYVVCGFYACNVVAQVQVQDNNAEQTLKDIKKDTDKIKSNTGDIKSNTDDIKTYTNDVYKELQINKPNLERLSNTIPQLTDSMAQLADAAVSQLAKSACPGATGTTTSVDGVMQTLSSTMALPYVQAQQTICEDVVIVNADKYNRTIQMVGRLKTYFDLARNTENNRDEIQANDGSASDQNGDLSANTNQSVRNFSNLQAEMSAWRARLAADDAILGTLNQMKSGLATAAMNGPQDGMGVASQSIQAAALAAALHLAE